METVSFVHFQLNTWQFYLFFPSSCIRRNKKSFLAQVFWSIHFFPESFISHLNDFFLILKNPSLFSYWSYSILLIIAVMLPYTIFNFTILFLMWQSIAHSVYSLRYFYAERKFLFPVAFINLGRLASSVFLLVVTVSFCPHNYGYVERYMI